MTPRSSSARSYVRGLATTGTALVAALTLTACGSGGTISIPTISIPTTIPSITIPTVPTQTSATAPVTTTATGSRTEATGTVTVTRTERPSTTTVTSTATAAPQPAPAAGAGVPAWAWIVLALLLLLLIGLIVWLVRRSRVRAAWDERMAVAERNSLWVEDSLVQQVLTRTSTQEAADTWQSAQARLLALDESLHSLTVTAPDPERAARATQLRARVTALVEAVGAETHTGASASVDDLRARRATVLGARSDLRGWLDAQKPRR